MPVPTCSNSCDANLATVNFSDCAPEVVFSEIRRVFLAKSTAAAFATWGQAAEWTTRLSQTSVSGDDYIRPLTVIADKPAATGVVKDISNGRKKTIGKDHVINFTIDDMSQENYEFMRSLECGGEFKMWYETEGGYMYGGPDGIKVNVDANVVNNRGREEIETINGVITWRDKFSPERVLSPIFGSSTGTDPGVYDTVMTFAADDEATEAGVTATASAVDPDVKFEFNAIIPAPGTPFTMNIKLTSGGATVMVVSAPSQYNGYPFKYTDVSGVSKTGNFASGDVIPT